MTDDMWIRPGVECTWQGQAAVVRQVGAMVVLSDPLGVRGVEVPVAEVASVLRGTEAPPDLPQLHDVEDRLSDVAKERRKIDADLLSIMLTGLRTDQPSTMTPPADLNPAFVAEGVRRRRLAALLAEEVRKKGSRAGFHVLVKSEMRRLQRIMQRWRDRQSLLDGRYTRPRTWRTDPAVIDALLTFMTSLAIRATISNRAIARKFVRYVQKERRDLELPSHTTLRRRVADIRGGFTHLSANAKNRISELNVPDVAAVSRLATRPGELVLFDTTKANVWVKDPRTGRVSRLDVTLAIDLATRCIVGVAITHSTNKHAIGLCLADVLRPKTAALAAEWTSSDDLPFNQPFIGRPDAFVCFHSAAFHPEGIVADNGMPYVSEYFTAQCARLGIHYEPQRSYTPTDKAQVERVFRTIKDMFEALMPGFTGGSVYEKGVDAREEDLMSPAEYERRIRQCIDLYNHRTHEGLVLPDDPFVRVSPYTMFGILAGRVGAIPDVAFQHEWIRFLPSVAVTVRPSRVRVRRLNYKSRALRELQGDPAVLKTGKLRVFYDPFDMRFTWCFASSGALHALRWQHLSARTPRFGEQHTNHVVSQFANTRVGTDDVERILQEIFDGAYDDPRIAQLENARHDELVDSLMRHRLSALSDDALTVEAARTSQASPSPQAALASGPKESGSPGTVPSGRKGPSVSSADCPERLHAGDIEITDASEADELTVTLRRPRRTMATYDLNRLGS
jgi:putative transposase